jgi:hypothetical protein
MRLFAPELRALTNLNITAEFICFTRSFATNAPDPLRTLRVVPRLSFRRVVGPTCFLFGGAVFDDFIHFRDCVPRTDSAAEIWPEWTDAFMWACSDACKGCRWRIDREIDPTRSESFQRRRVPRRFARPPKGHELQVVWSKSRARSL